MAIALACTAPACTLGLPLVFSGGTAIHNGIANDENHWNYTKPILIGAALGFVVDIYLLVEAASKIKWRF